MNIKYFHMLFKYKSSQFWLVFILVLYFYNPDIHFQIGDALISELPFISYKVNNM